MDEKVPPQKVPIIQNCDRLFESCYIPSVSRQEHPRECPLAAGYREAACQPSQPTPTPASKATRPSTGPAAISAPARTASNLFDVAWDGRTIFCKDLINAEQAVLDRVPGAKVYHIDSQISDDFSSLQGREKFATPTKEICRSMPSTCNYFPTCPAANPPCQRSRRMSKKSTLL